MKTFKYTGNYRCPFFSSRSKHCTQKGCYHAQLHKQRDSCLESGWSCHRIKEGDGLPCAAIYA